MQQISIYSYENSVWICRFNLQLWYKFEFADSVLFMLSLDSQTAFSSFILGREEKGSGILTNKSCVTSYPVCSGVSTVGPSGACAPLTLYTYL